MNGLGYEIAIAIVLSFAIGTYLNVQLAKVHHKVDRLFDVLNGLREYLYEIDPQFDDERQSDRAFAEDRHIFAGMEDLELGRTKREAGFRTLHTGFLDGGFRSPRDR